MRLRKCEFDAQCFSARAKDCPWAISPPLPSRETSNEDHRRSEVNISDEGITGEDDDKKSHSPCNFPARYHADLIMRSRMHRKSQWEQSSQWPRLSISPFLSRLFSPW